jgi:hypothetical protein
VLLLPIKPQLNSKTLKAWGQKNRKAKNKQNKNCRKTHKLLRLKRQESKYLLSSLLFLPLTGSVSFRLLPRVSFFLSLCAILSPFYREISNILNHFTILLIVSALLLVRIKIKFQFKNVQLLEFVFLLLFLDYYQSKTINLRAMQCCFMCWLVHKSHCNGERIKIQ